MQDIALVKLSAQGKGRPATRVNLLHALGAGLYCLLVSCACLQASRRWALRGWVQARRDNAPCLFYAYSGLR